MNIKHNTQSAIIWVSYGSKASLEEEDSSGLNA